MLPLEFRSRGNLLEDGRKAPAALPALKRSDDLLLDALCGWQGADGRVPQPLLDAFATFQSELRVFSAECDAFNEKAEGASFPHCFGLWCWNPKYLETSVSV